VEPPSPSPSSPLVGFEFEVEPPTPSPGEVELRSQAQETVGSEENLRADKEGVGALDEEEGRADAQPTAISVCAELNGLEEAFRDAFEPVPPPPIQQDTNQDDPPVPLLRFREEEKVGSVSPSMPPTPPPTPPPVQRRSRRSSEAGLSTDAKQELGPAVPPGDAKRLMSVVVAMAVAVTRARRGAEGARAVAARAAPGDLARALQLDPTFVVQVLMAVVGWMVGNVVVAARERAVRARPAAVAVAM
jgi:hypothetical protein